MSQKFIIYSEDPNSIIVFQNSEFVERLFLRWNDMTGNNDEILFCHVNSPRLSEHIYHAALINKKRWLEAEKYITDPGLLYCYWYWLVEDGKPHRPWLEAEERLKKHSVWYAEYKAAYILRSWY